MLNHTCYLDLDGVLVDFTTGALKAHNKELKYEDITWDFDKQLNIEPTVFWEAFGYDFWANLTKTKECDSIIALVEKYFGDNVVLLSSPCKTKGCRDGKEEWVKNNLPFGYVNCLFTGKDKHKLAAPNKFLVDDYESNITKFEENNGKSFLVGRPWNVQKHNEPYLLNLMEDHFINFKSKEIVWGVMY